MLIIAVATATLLTCSHRPAVAAAATSAEPRAPVEAPTSPRRENTPASDVPGTVRPSDVSRSDVISTSAELDVDREIARAVAAWKRIRTLRATFQQTVTNPLTGSEMTARGALQQQKPNRLAINFTEPAGDRIVADGEFVWVYLQSATPGQVVKMRASDLGASNTDLIGQFLNTPRAKYDAADDGMDRVGDRPARVIVLTAKPGERLPFIRAKVWVDSADALIRQFDAVDANGISRKVRILTMSPNAPVDAAAFRFVVPDGVRVVER